MNENNINTDAVAENAEEEKRTPQQAVYDWIEIVAVSLSVVLLFLTFIARVTTVVGDSMLPTLHDGESLLVIGIGYTPKSGDIVVVQDDRSEINYPIVKRVIGTENDVIEFDFDNWTVYVNGEKLDEPYVTDPALGDCNIELPYQVPAEKYFVMGDHRSTSTDSRSTAVGCVALEQIVGRIVFRVWPLEAFGDLKA